MKNREFTKVGTVAIGGSRLIVKEYQHGGYFQIGTTRIPAQTKDEAVTRYKNALERRAAKQQEVH
jgi:hypothetical protein